MTFVKAKLNNHTGYVQGMHEIAWVIYYLFLRDGVAAQVAGRPSTRQGLFCWETRSSTPYEAEADTFFCLYDILTRLHPLYMFEQEMSNILKHARACLEQEYVVMHASEMH